MTKIYKKSNCKEKERTIYKEYVSEIPIELWTETEQGGF